MVCKHEIKVLIVSPHLIPGARTAPKNISLGEITANFFFIVHRIFVAIFSGFVAICAPKFFFYIPKITYIFELKVPVLVNKINNISGVIPVIRITVVDDVVLIITQL